MPMPDDLKPTHCLGFFLCAFARSTDNDFDREEIGKVFDLMQKHTPESLQKDFKIICDDTFKWFAGEWNAGEESFTKVLHECINTIEHIFKDTPDEIKKMFVNDVISLAKADGKVLESEVAWIQNLCKVITIEVISIDYNIVDTAGMCVLLLVEAISRIFHRN